MALFEAKCLIILDVVSPFNKLPEDCDNEDIARIDNSYTLQSEEAMK